MTNGKRTWRQKKKLSNKTQIKNKTSFMCFGRVSSSSSTSGTRRVTLFKNPVISHEWGKNEFVITAEGIYQRSDYADFT